MDIKFTIAIVSCTILDAAIEGHGIVQEILRHQVPALRFLVGLANLKEQGV